MKKIFFLASLVCYSFIGCDRLKDQPPTIQESINYIEHIVASEEIETSLGVYHDISFEVVDQKIIYTVYFSSDTSNSFYRYKEQFDITDIVGSYVSGSFTGNLSYSTIKVNLRSDNSNRRTFLSMNEKTAQNYGFEDVEFLESAYIYVPKHNDESINKAFKNIAEALKKDRREDYFQ